MTTAFLITTDKIKKHGYTQGNVGDEIVTPTLRRVQDHNLKPILGSQLFKRLLAGVNASDLNANETLLLETFIKDYLTASVDHKIVNHLIFQLRNATAGSTKDNMIAPLTSAERVTLLDDLRRDEENYGNDLIDHLKDNAGLFLEYKEWICSKEFVKPANNAKVSVIRFS